MNMKRFMNKKVAAIGLASALALGIAGGAFAYFTNTGTGTGSATVGSTSNQFTVSVVESSVAGQDAALLPTPLGDSNATLDTENVTVTNNDEANEYLSTLVYEITPGFDVTSLGHPDCVAADFSINGAAVGTPVTVHPDQNLAALSDSGSYSTSFTLQLVDNGADQDACEGVTVPLTANAS